MAVAIWAYVIVKVSTRQITKCTSRGYLAVVKYVVDDMNVIRQHGRSTGRTIDRWDQAPVMNDWCVGPAQGQSDAHQKNLHAAWMRRRVGGAGTAFVARAHRQRESRRTGQSRDGEIGINDGASEVLMCLGVPHLESVLITGLIALPNAATLE